MKRFIVSWTDYSGGGRETKVSAENAKDARAKVIALAGKLLLKVTSVGLAAAPVSAKRYCTNPVPPDGICDMCGKNHWIMRGKRLVKVAPEIETILDGGYVAPFGQ